MAGSKKKSVKSAAGLYNRRVAPKLDEVAGWARRDVSEEQIAKNLGVAYSTFRKYKGAHAELARALDAGREASVLVAESSLFRRVTGYTRELKKTFKLRETYYDDENRKCDRERLETGVEEVHVPADTKAIVFFLTNRDAERWQVKPEAKDEEENRGGVVLLPQRLPDEPVPEDEADGQ